MYNGSSVITVPVYIITRCKGLFGENSPANDPVNDGVNDGVKNIDNENIALKNDTTNDGVNDSRYLSGGFVFEQNTALHSFPTYTQ
mgnify:CR=1 FL=1